MDADAHELASAAWEANATCWDDYMGDEGNAFVNALIWPATERLLPMAEGMRLLDAACGNGLYARRLAARGCHVQAFDVSPTLIQRATARAEAAGLSGQVRFHVLDGTDADALSAHLSARSLDGAICHMALMDMPAIRPLFDAVASALKPGAPLVFSVSHPCLNHPRTHHLLRAHETDGRPVTQAAMEITAYASPYTTQTVALSHQPHTNPFYHRPLHVLLGEAFEAGLACDGIEEPTFAPPPTDETPRAGWNGHFAEFPPVLVCRLRAPGA